MDNPSGFSAAEREINQIAARYPQAKAKIIFAPTLAWDSEMFQRPQQLARALARQGALVFYLQPEKGWPANFVEIEERLYLSKSPSDAFHVLPDAFVYVVTWNIPLLAFFTQPRIIYDVLDTLDVFDGDPKQLQRDHQRTLRKADLVLTSSQPLQEAISQIREDSILCPNGVDVDHFQPGQEDVLPEDFRHIVGKGKPILGYHGAMARWFDYKLLSTLAGRHPEWHFVLIGIDHDQTLQESRVLDRANIDWLGPRPYQKLPGYVQAFDVGMIPFVPNEITHATSPIKLFEYAAAEVPIVVSPLRECLRYGLPLVGDSLQAWEEKIWTALNLAEDENYLQELRHFAQTNSWQKRADTILTSLEQVSDTPPPSSWYERISIQNPYLQRLMRLVAQVINVWRMSGLRGVAQGAYYKLTEVSQRIKLRKLLKWPRKYRDTYIPDDISQVVLYRDQKQPFPDYQPREPLAGTAESLDKPVSLIVTVYNEEDSAAAWFESIYEQTRLPDEIVIVDAQSSDQTLQRVQEQAKRSPVPLRVIAEKKINIAQGRNVAVKQAQYDLIAVTDFGCRPHPDWLEKITAPFAARPGTEVVAGWYRAVDGEGRCVNYQVAPDLEEVSPQTFLPSSRSLAFTKDAWEKAGGYPTWLTQTGEDTYFALELKRFCVQWAFVPAAVVDWVGPTSWVGLWKKAYRWSMGNGELGYNAPVYRQAALNLVLLTVIFLLGGLLAFTGLFQFPGTMGTLEGLRGSAGVLLLLIPVIFFLRKGYRLGEIPRQLGLRLAQVLGFLEGASRKDEVDRRRLAATEGVFFILAGVPMEDTGGGARSAQLALELLRQNYWVVYLNRYPSWEEGEAEVRIGHPNLFRWALEDFSWERFLELYGQVLEGKRLTGLVELPLGEYLPVMERIEEAGGTVIYEMIDDWDTALGGEWYLEEIEEEVIRRSQGLVATAPVLQEKLARQSGREVLLLPNAVNARLFNPARRAPRPGDMPEAAWTAVYVGALWGEWFSWELLEAVAEGYPEAGVVVIGDYRGQCPDPPENLHFLGLKAQRELPGYLAHSEVALIPWEVSQITQATSPLKVYEYLAMEKPVVAPRLGPLEGIPGVYLAEDRAEFVTLVNQVRTRSYPAQAVRDYIAANHWGGRVKELLRYLDGLQQKEKDTFEG